MRYSIKERLLAYLDEYVERYPRLAEIWGISMAVKPPFTSVVLGEDYHTSQIYSTGVEFAMVGRVGKKWKQATTFVFCKDFLHDAIWAMLHKRPVSIYDFSYSPPGSKPAKEPRKGTCEWYDWSSAQRKLDTEDGKLKIDIPIHMARTALLFRDTNLKGVVGKKRFHEHRVGALDFLHQVDEQMGFSPTEIHQVKGTKDGPPTWLVLGDKRWMHAPTLLSLYSILIRVGYYHNPGGEFMRTLEMMKDGELGIGNAAEDFGDGAAGCNDTSYVGQAWKGIRVILKHGMKVFHEEMIENYPGDIRTSILHDTYGIVNFTKKRPEKRMPHWYRKSLWK